VPESILERFGVDLRSVKTGKPRSSGECAFPDGSYRDCWGVTFAPALGGAYYDISANPLREANIDDLDAYHPFDPLDSGISEGAEDRARRIVEDTDYALVGNLTESQIFERAWQLRGFEQFLMDLHLDKRFAHKLLRLVTDFQIQRLDPFLRGVGKHLSIVKVSDDLAGQLMPLMSPETYREMLRPYHTEYFAHIRERTDAPLALHSCGNIRPLIPDLLDAGVQVIHPFQACCDAMEPSGLKREFGSRLVFWGGMDTQKFLPHATPEAVCAQVRRIIALMSGNGGFIFAPSHNLQGDVPPANIDAMYSEAQRTAVG
jgi:uroporphyrinogen decarboxylase